MLGLYRIIPTNPLKENQAIAILPLHVIWLFELSYYQVGILIFEILQ